MDKNEVKSEIPEELMKEASNPEKSGKPVSVTEDDRSEEITDSNKVANDTVIKGGDDKKSSEDKKSGIANQVKSKPTKKKTSEDKSVKKKPAAKPVNKKDSKPKSTEKDENIETKETKDRSDDIIESAKKTVDEEVKSVEYSKFSIENLVNTLTILVSERPVQEVKEDVDHIKANFYKKLKVETDQKKARFLKEGGQPEDFSPGTDPREDKLKSLLNLYKKKKSEYTQQLEFEKKANLEEKYSLIEGIKNLINKEESINKTFQEFRELQNKWRTIGLVPQSKLKDLWETYHYHVEKFYDYIKINRELRDLDLKKNLEIKILLCEKAEDLLMEVNVVSAFRTLQKYHEQWREIGPVPHESKDEIWERFRVATSKINRKHQEHFEGIKAALKKNLEAKTELCEKIEEILNLEIKTHKDWEVKSREIIEMQKLWKTIGFAPRKYNNQIYERFRKVCDEFFNRKRVFYSENKELQQNNLQLKTDLCIQAEALQQSEEWKKSTEDLIALQKKWKEIGPVPKRNSDKIWKKFRTACDTFFNRKSEYYANIEKKYVENLQFKIKLIEEIEQFQFGDNMDKNFEDLQKFQRKWTEIGFVPIKEKEAIMQRYRIAINKLFDDLDIDETRKSILKYKNKLESLPSNQRVKEKLFNEREKFVIKVKKLENDIVLWENNIGFFAKSDNANSMIKEVSQKITQAKQNLETLVQKIKMIDDLNI